MAEARVRLGAVALLFAVAVAAVGLDQGSKALVVANLVEGQRVELLGPVLSLLLLHNAGAAYSLGAGMTWIFAIIASAVAVVLVLFARRIRSLGWAVTLGLLLGGTVGNLLDRLFREPGFGVGRVVDFISLPWLGFTCNVADIAISAAVVVFLVLTVRGIGFDGRRQGKAADEAPVSEDAVPEEPGGVA